MTIEEVNLTLYWKVCHRTKQNKKARRHAKEGRNQIRKMNTIDKQIFLICGLFFHLTSALAMSFHNIFKC